MKLRVGLIGAGGMGYLHLAGYKKNEQCELIAVASRTEQSAKNASKKFNISHFYWGNDWIKMLRDEQLDVVSICSPNFYHAQMAIEAIRNGVNVLCEKPIAVSFEELRQLEVELSQKKVIFFSSFQKRYHNLIPKVKDIVETGILGRINLVRYFLSHYGPYTSWRPMSEQKWFFDSKLAGGGVLLDLGVHAIDLLRHLIGEFDVIEGFCHNTICQNIIDEDNCSVLFRFKNDAIGIITTSWCNEPIDLIEVFGTNGMLRIDLTFNEPLFFRPNKLKKNPLIKVLIKSKASRDITQHVLINHFINCIISGNQEKPDFKDGKRAVEFVLKSYLKSSIKNKDNI
jgi:UDP-N-acetylglucosamine 3-dehydrogenase